MTLRERFAPPKLLVLLDLDGTLHDARKSWSIARARAIQAMMRAGLDAPSEKEATELFDRVYRENPNSDRQVEQVARHYLRHRLRGGELLARMQKVEAAGVEALAATLHDRRTFKPFGDAKPHLQFLREQGIPFWIVTDGIPCRQWAKLHRLGLSDYVDADRLICTGSTRVTLRASRVPYPHLLFDPHSRPKNQGFYQRVLQVVGVLPSDAHRVVMIGDREKSDVIPAKAAGITTIRLRRTGGKYSADPTEADYVVKSLGGVKRILLERMSE